MMLSEGLSTGEWLGILIPSSVALVGVIATIVIFFLQRPKLALMWQVLTNERLISPSAPSDVSIVHKGVQLDHPRILTLRVKNVGRKEVAESDWRSPLTIKVPKADIIDARILRTSNNASLSVGLNIQPDDTLTVFPNFFLNAKMSVDLQLILETQQNPLPKLDGVILGESRSIRMVGAGPSSAAKLLMIIALAGGILGAISALVSAQTKDTFTFLTPLATVLILAVLWLVVVIPVIFRRSNREDDGPS